jgi:hypothetical protein
VFRYSVLLLALPLAAANPPARFAEHVIATDLRGGYQVVVADLNRDGKPDLIGLASGMKELVWFENPSWERHVIAGDLNRMINCAVVEMPGDPTPAIVIATEFANQAQNSIGVVSVLRANGDVRKPWTVTEIDRLTTSHRLRTAKIDGSSQRVVINAPLTGAKAEAPEYRDQTPLVFYRPGEWKRQTISTENSGVVHGIYIVDWDGDGRDDVLTASFTGIHLFRFAGGKWSRTEIAKGDPAAWPKSGSSDVAVGTIGRQRFLAAIEPWHGNQVAIYRQKGGAWNRQVIDDSLVDGHTIIAADLNGDGSGEVIAGYRGKGRSVFVYSAEDSAGERWSKQTLDDGGMAAAACAAADLNGDGRVDIACIGSASTNLKWYENLGAAKSK